MNIGYYYEYEDVKRCIKNTNINKVYINKYLEELDDIFEFIDTIEVTKKVDKLMIDLKNNYDLHKEHTFPRPTKYNIILPEPTLEELKKENEELKNQLKEYKNDIYSKRIEKIKPFKNQAKKEIIK